MKTTLFLCASVVALVFPVARALAQAPACPPVHDEGVYGKLPLAFVANKGQQTRPVRFYATSPRATVYFTPTEVVFHFAEQEIEPAPPVGLAGAEPGPPRSDAAAGGRELVVRVGFADANPNVILEGQEELPGRVNIFRGRDPSQWLTAIPTYRKLIYRNLWDGIDLVYYGMPGCGMKYDLVLRPGADPSKIRLRYSGCDPLAVSAAGELVIGTPFGPIVEQRPEAYQEINGERVAVPASFVVVVDAVAWRLVGYDSRYPVVIDPGIVYGTFLGGTKNDQANSIAVDGAGCTYVTGLTASTGFPTTAGAFDTSYGANTQEVFVTKLNAAGTGLVYSTFLSGVYGGSSTNSGNGIAVDAAGCAYVTGYTYISDFPTTEGAYDTSFNGYCDAFLTKLDPSGAALVYSTFLGGGTGYDMGTDIEVDDSGCAYVTGRTSSPDFPTSAGAYDATYNGGGSNPIPWDAFVAKVNATGSELVYSTFLGGTGDDVSYGIAVDASGCAYVGGETNSAGFPTTAGAFDTTHSGGYNAFVTKVDASGTSLVYSTFLGSSSINDRNCGIAVDTAGCAYAAGVTQSSDCPTTAGAYDTSFNGSSDFYVTKLNAEGTGLVYSTFLGGSSLEQGVTIDVDPSGCACLTGDKYSSNFPLTPDAPASGYSFLTVFNASGTDLLYSAALGGNAGLTVGRSIAVGANSCAYIAGYTNSSTFPATAGAYDTSWSGNYDAFVAMFEIGPHVYRATVTPDGASATVRWNALPDTSYLVEWSEDLAAWTQVAVGATSEWTDSDTAGHRKKFYRVREAE